MAQFTRVSGDFVPQINYDAQSYTVGSVNAFTSAATVQPQGPKLEFGTITFTGQGVMDGANLKIAMDTIQQVATIYMYEFTVVGSGADKLAVAVYPVSAWDFANTGNLDVALTAALGGTVDTVATATFTN